MSELPIVLVTGASGFIATHVVSILLAEKKYRVRGTVRDANNEKSTKPLKDAFPELELVSADLNKDDGWKEAVAGCTYVHHLASHPFENPRDRNELIRPAVDGTKRVLEACAEAGTVKRVILTSSIAAISTGYLGNEDKPHDHVYTPDDWTNPDSQRCPAYEASKTYAEKAAWEFVEKLEGEKKFELVTIHPAGVFGPLILPRTSVSHIFFETLLTRKMSSVPDIMVPFVDVRDVSKAHVAAMTKGISGQRYILWSESPSLRTLAHILAEEFNPQGYRVPVANMWKMTLWIGTLFSAQAKIIYNLLGCHVTCDISKMKEDLGIEPIGLKECSFDSAYSLIEHGIIPKMAGLKSREKKEEE
ncbi:uncharacterized protein [Oscarella lobularis]|uniref:uncharacterized protein isoform X1 n=1 Tax=Oscarella lobularis TaxID=121494 RepID=UPI00331427C9